MALSLESTRHLLALQALLDPRGRKEAEVVRKFSPGALKHVPRVVCADGFELSVQASECHHCFPRNSRGPWIEVEVGFPSEKVDAFMPYIDSHDSSPTDTIYGYVPIATVVQVIADHGGLESDD